MENIETLLKKVGEIVKRYEKEDRETGRRFNVYSIAGIERDEVKTHSRMIAELLDPKGSHGQGDLFLKLFFEQLGLNFECKNFIVNYEKKYNPYGQVDIEITSDNHYIIIENKIDAPDQFKQLERYSDIAEKVKKYSEDKYTLLYLTRYGREPSQESLGVIKKGKISKVSDCSVWKKGNQDVDLRLISYREDIRNWLEECIKQSVFIPNIRDALTQYLNLVKKITGIERTTIMDHVIEELLNNTENLKYAGSITQAFNSSQLRGKILFDFFENIQKKLEEKKYVKINREKIIHDDQQYLYVDSDNTEKPCVEWFESKTKNGETGKKSWEGKGFFMGIPNNPNSYLHIQVSTDALHYGLVQANVKDGILVFAENNDEIAKKIQSDIFTPRDWKRWNFYWFSNIYTNANNVRIFDNKVIELLTDETEISKFVTTIDEEINGALEK